jgi:hypothetical protein
MFSSCLIDFILAACDTGVESEPSLASPATARGPRDGLNPNVNSVNRSDYTLSTLLLAPLHFKYFCTNIIKYNQAFAFTLLGYNVDYLINKQMESSVFQIQSELSHLTKGLISGLSDTVCTQIYIYDQECAEQIYLRNNKQYKLCSILVGSETKFYEI